MTRSSLICATAAAVALASLAAPSAFASKDLRQFQSPSKNIGCIMAKGQSGHGVRCDIRNHTWQAPPKPSSCQLDYGNGLEVGLRGKAHFVCAGDTVLGQGPVLPYGNSIRFGGFKCESRQKGMRCLNRHTRHGFLLSRTVAKRF
jgi:hypothetical protein